MNCLVRIVQTNCDSCEIETRGLLYNLGEFSLHTVCVSCKMISCVREKHLRNAPEDGSLIVKLTP
jgi:hypothetical protein